MDLDMKKKMYNLKVSVVREKLTACMRCGICDKLMRDATTISECMHHFCRKCIYRKITVDEVENCPVCDVNLGADPLEKLRPDHNLRELRAKIFGSKRLSEAQSANVELESLSESNFKRKERSLSSLGANGLKRRSEPVMTSKRMKHQTRKSRYLQSSSHFEKSNEKNSSVNGLLQHSSSSDDKHKSSDEKSEDEWPFVKKATDKVDTNVKTLHTSDDIWNPLNCLVEVANKTKPVSAKIPNTPDDEVQVRKNRMKDYTPKTNIDTRLLFSNPRKSRKALSKKTPDIPIHIIPSSSFSEASSSKERKNVPIWLQLVASENQGTGILLPQISTRYLRIKDGSMTVSYVRKYIMQKLNVSNEDEIEIACMGQSLADSMPLTDIVTIWLQATSTASKITVTVGSSAKDFIMVLTYTRKVTASAPMPPPLPPPASTLSFLHL